MTELLPDEQKSLNVFLAEAIRDLDLRRIKLCVQKGADLSATMSMTQVIAVPNGSREQKTVTAPVTHLILADVGNMTDAMRAVADFFVTQGVNLNSKNADGNTPLEIQVRSGNTARVAWLLDNGASLKIASNNWLPIERARELPHNVACRREIIDVILSHMPNLREDFDSVAAPDIGIGIDEQIVAPDKITVGPRKNGRDNTDGGLRF